MVFMENIEKGLDYFVQALRETSSYSDIIRMEYNPKEETVKVIFNSTYATVNVRGDSLYGMYCDIIRHLERIARREIWWG